MSLVPSKKTIVTRETVTVQKAMIVEFTANEQDRSITIRRVGLDSEGNEIYRYPPVTIRDQPSAQRRESETLVVAEGKVTIAHATAYDIKVTQVGVSVLYEDRDFTRSGDELTFSATPDGTAVEVNYQIDLPSQNIFTDLMLSAPKGATVYEVVSNVLWDGLIMAGHASGTIDPSPPPS